MQMFWRCLRRFLTCMKQCGLSRRLSAQRGTHLNSQILFYIVNIKLCIVVKSLLMLTRKIIPLCAILMTLTLFQGHVESCVKHLNSKVINSLTHQSMYCNSVDLS